MSLKIKCPKMILEHHLNNGIGLPIFYKITLPPLALFREGSLPRSNILPSPSKITWGSYQSLYPIQKATHSHIDKSIYMKGTHSKTAISLCIMGLWINIRCNNIKDLFYKLIH